MMSELSVMYGWSRHYILWELDLNQVLRYYKYGFRFYYEARGWKFKTDIDAKPWSEVRKDVYTPEQKRLQEEALKKQYGQNIEGL